MNVGSLVARHARYRGQHVALVVDDTRLRFDELGARVKAAEKAAKASGSSTGEKKSGVIRSPAPVVHQSPLSWPR